MKRIFLAVTFLATTFSFSQEFSIGGKVGLNLNSLSGDVANPKMTTGFHAGAMGELKLSDAFSIQPELLYSMQGGEVSRTVDDIKFFAVTEISTSYINLPVMGKFYVTDEFSIEAGPQIGFLMSSKADVRTYIKTPILNIPLISREFGIKERSSTIDYGVNLGVSYKLDNGISFGARYTLGLSNFNDGESPDLTDIKLEDIGAAGALGNSAMKNNTIQVSIGYFFN